MCAMCIECGCDEINGCAGGCSWLRVDHEEGLGVCSMCSDRVSDWDRGDRTLGEEAKMVMEMPAPSDAVSSRFAWLNKVAPGDRVYLGRIAMGTRSDVQQVMRVTATQVVCERDRLTKRTGKVIGSLSGRMAQPFTDEMAEYIRNGKWPPIYDPNELPEKDAKKDTAAATAIRPDILTAHGVYFDFLTPDPDTIHIQDIAHALANICRFGGHTRHFYSVAQHCVLASQIVPEEDALWALLHDAAEAYVGDVSRPLKQLLPDYKVIEKRVEAAVLAKFGLTGPMPASVEHADLVLLATEQRDLMPAHEDEWSLIAGITSLDDLIIPWDSASAELAFLDRFRVLTAKREASDAS